MKQNLHISCCRYQDFLGPAYLNTIAFMNSRKLMRAAESFFCCCSIIPTRSAVAFDTELRSPISPRTPLMRSSCCKKRRSVLVRCDTNSCRISALLSSSSAWLSFASFSINEAASLEPLEYTWLRNPHTATVTYK